MKLKCYSVSKYAIISWRQRIWFSLKPGKIWYDLSLFTELDVAMAAAFWQACFILQIWIFLLSFDYFEVSFDGLMTSWKIKKIEESNITTVHEIHLICRHRVISFIGCFHMTSWQPYLCLKTTRRRPCWCPNQSCGRCTLSYVNTFFSPFSLQFMTEWG